jgi:ribosomal protein L32
MTKTEKERIHIIAHIMEMLPEAYLDDNQLYILDAILTGAKVKVDRTWVSKDNTKRTTRYSIEITSDTKCRTCGDYKRVGYWSTMHDQWLDQGPCPDCGGKL